MKSRPAIVTPLLLFMFVGPLSQGAARSASTDLPGIVGKDDRQPLNTAEWPWAAIGRVNQKGGAHCTGTLIAPNRVLTAAHCIYDAKAAKWLRPEDVVFVPDFRPGHEYSFSRGVSFAYVLKSVPSKIDTAFMAQDWAVITLEKSLIQRPVSVRPISEDWVSNVDSMTFLSGGYSVDRPYLLSVDYECHLKARLAEDAVFMTDCDSTKGNSGSPLLIRHGPNEWHVVGVFSSAAQQGSLQMGTFAVNAKVFFGKY